jgi:hypothetical protein
MALGALASQERPKLIEKGGMRFLQAESSQSHHSKPSILLEERCRDSLRYKYTKSYESLFPKNKYFAG